MRDAIMDLLLSKLAKSHIEPGKVSLPVEWKGEPCLA